MIEALLEVRGIQAAALVDAKGNITSQVGQEEPDLTIIAAARATLSSLQKALETPKWNDLLLDLDGGPVLLVPVEDSILMTRFDDVAHLGRVRFAIKRVLSHK